MAKAVSMLLLLLLVGGVAATNLECAVAFDVAPELRARASLEYWAVQAYRAVSLMNRELRMHGSGLFFAVHSVTAIELGHYGTPANTLAAYAAERPVAACVHLLLSQRDFNSIIGLAYVDKRCTSMAFAAVFDAADDASFRQTAFHEILHVVGADHTEDDATSVLAPALAWNMGLTDDPHWALNTTRRGCETVARRYPF